MNINIVRMETKKHISIQKDSVRRIQCPIDTLNSNKLFTIFFTK